MQETNLVVAQFTRAQLFVNLFGGGDLQLVALGNHRADHVGLLPRVERLAHCGPHVTPCFVVVDGNGLNRCATWRQLVEHAHFKVAVVSERCGSRYWCRCHHQHVGRGVFLPGALAAQRSPLLDPEAMLLVDHHHAERRKLDTFLNQCVGADDDVDTARGEVGEHLAAPLARHTAREQLDAQLSFAKEIAVVGHAQIVEQRSNASKVLLGKHFGRGHQRTLVTTLHRHQHRRHRHHRLAATDVALQ